MKRMLDQKDFWDSEVERFDAIYSHKKSRFAVLLDKSFRWTMYRRFAYTLQQSEPIHTKTFLDVGCGTGRYSLELARRGAKKVVGIDVSERMIEVCNRRAKKENIEDRARFILADIMEYEPDEAFDICIGMGLLDYIKNPLPTLTRIRGLTREKAFLSFPVLWSWRTLPRKLRLGLKRCPVYFYTRRRIYGLLTDAGFKRIIIKKMGPMYFVIAFRK
ncbi:MAG: methyltransferase domain-containing protein [candidate division WOR-3 bacterium]|nr:methyltransferase domain-containing protein [candidate division WOR-3 bacterium]